MSKLFSIYYLILNNCQPKQSNQLKNRFNNKIDFEIKNDFITNALSVSHVLIAKYDSE